MGWHLEIRNCCTCDVVVGMFIRKVEFLCCFLFYVLWSG